MSDEEKDWKLKLRYGKTETSYIHYTVLADGEVQTPNEEYQTSIGNAVMGIKVWAENTDEAQDVVRAIGQQLGFSAKGKMEIYETDPEQPPSENPSAYGVNFTKYD